MSQSPKWKKPSDVMKIHRKKRPVSCGGINSPLNATVSGKNLADSCVVKGKRKNPFGCSPRKKLNIEQEQVTASENTDQPINSGPAERVLFDVLNQKDLTFPRSKEAVPADGLYPKGVDPNCHKDTTETVKKNTEIVHDTKEPEPRHVGYPCDWSLKTKVRITSSSPFGWCVPLKTAEEAQGMERFIQNSPALSDLLGQLPQHNKSAKAEFHKYCMYWTHPNIPWLKLFPRMVPDNKIGKTSAVLQDKEVLQSVMSDWTESFTSVFHLLRTGSCPYFYMCCHIFTVVFFAANTRSSPCMEAIITPSSRGFREALKTEGIEFSLPLQNKRTDDIESTGSKPSNENDTSVQVDHQENQEEKPTDQDICPDNTATVEKRTALNDEEDDEDDLEHTDEGAASWLETLGLDKAHYRSLDPNKVKLQRDSFRLIDNRPESTIYVSGTQTQALFNYLLNCRSCVANTGVQAGIPPTLLAPTAFKGATLKSLKVKQGNIRQQTATDHGYCLEVTGPILPSTYLGLNHILTLSQTDYTAAYSAQEQTAPFNVAQDHPQYDSISTESLSEHQSFGMNLGKEVIRELSFIENTFSWNKY